MATAGTMEAASMLPASVCMICTHGKAALLCISMAVRKIDS